MFKKLYQSTSQSVQGAAIVLAISAILAQLFGLVRDKLLAHLVGPGAMLDVYYSAFRIPDILFNTVATFFSAAILLPFLANYLNKGDEVGGRRFLRDSTISFSILIIIVCTVTYFLFPYLSRGLVIGFSEPMRILYIQIGRILLLSPIILGLSNLIGTITQYYKHFIIWSLAPLFYNIGIICGILFYPRFGLNAIVSGVVFGALLHLSIQLPIIYKHKYLKLVGLGQYRFKEMFSIFKTALPRTISLSLNNLVMLILIATATIMSVGSVSLFTFAYTISLVPLTLIGLTFSVAVFPDLSKIFNQSTTNQVNSEFVEKFKSTARKIFALTTIIAFVFIIFRGPLIDLLLGSGAFTSYHTLRTSWLLFIACFGMVPAGMVQLYLRAFYATGDTRRPFIATFITAISTIIITLFGLFIFNTTNFPVTISNLTGLLVADTYVLVLTFAVAISSIINVFLLRAITRKYLGISGTISKSLIFKTLFVAIASNIIAFGFYKLVISYADGTAMRYGLFIVTLIIDAVIIYALAKKMQLNEVYDYMKAYIAKII